jgi:hypothetical protein
LDNYYNLTDEVSEFLYTFGKDGTNNWNLILDREKINIKKKIRGVYIEE